MGAPDMILAVMTAADWPEVAAVYREGIATGQATFAGAPPADYAEFSDGRLMACAVVARAGDGGSLLGWATLAGVSDRCVYAGVAEVSVYVAGTARGRGVGGRLLGGVPTRRVAELFGEHYGLKLDPDHVFHTKEAYFTELQGDARLIEPVVAFARRMFATHPLAIASGGPRVIVHRSLEITGLRPLFRAVVSADDVVHGKPSPDMFLLAAEQLGVPPAQCLVFEDAEPGIQGALAAGMQVVRVPSRI